MKTITAVPEFLTRAQYLSLIESVGFDVQHVRSLAFKTDGVYAEVYDVNDAGHHYVVYSPTGEDEPATNRIFIPVRDE